MSKLLVFLPIYLSFQTTLKVGCLITLATAGTLQENVLVSMEDPRGPSSTATYTEWR